MIRILISLLLFLGACNLSAQQKFQEAPLFVNGQEGYTCYRIPAIVKAGNGDLLAFAEGRKQGCGDFGNVDIVLKVSKDNGLSWSALKLVADNGMLQAGNPAPLLDLMNPAVPEGELFLLYNTGNVDERAMREGKGIREVWVISSKDHGQSWSEPKNITLEAHRPKNPGFNPKYNFSEDWRSYALTPGHAFQVGVGPQKGRLFVSANHSAGTPQAGFNEYRSHALYSDDHGQSWQITDNVDIPSANEATAAYLADGRIMMNIRQQNGKERQRLIAISNADGISWERTYFDSTLIGPVCQASLLNYTTPGGFDALLFSNPASTSSRNNMTIRLSVDQGRNWTIGRSIRTGPSAYSDLVVQEDADIGLLYEHGNNGGIHYAHFNFDWLAGDMDAAQYGAFIQKLKGKALANTADFQLSNPRLLYDKTFLTEAENVYLKTELPGTSVHYTLNGKVPQETDPVFNEKMEIDQTATIKVRAFHPDFKASNVVSAQFFKVEKRLPVQSIQLKYPPSDKYAGQGAPALVDGRKGPLGFQDPAWMGFNGSDVDCEIVFKRKEKVEKVTVSLLVNTGAWIFGPEAIEIQASENGRDFIKISEKAFPVAQVDDPGGQEYLSLSFKAQKIKALRVIVKKRNIPDWHPGKGTPAWLFVDEIVVE